MVRQMLLGSLLLLGACAHRVPSGTESQYSFSLTHEGNEGWGYVIEKDGKAIIRQPHIPGIAGSHAFGSKEDAAATAELMIYKLERGVFPPAVHQSELDSLGVDLDFE